MNTVALLARKGEARKTTYAIHMGALAQSAAQSRRLVAGPGERDPAFGRDGAWGL